MPIDSAVQTWRTDLNTQNPLEVLSVHDENGKPRKDIVYVRDTKTGTYEGFDPRIYEKIPDSVIRDYIMEYLESHPILVPEPVRVH